MPAGSGLFAELEELAAVEGNQPDGWQGASTALGEEADVGAAEDGGRDCLDGRVGVSSGWSSESFLSVQDSRHHTSRHVRRGVAQEIANTFT